MRHEIAPLLLALAMGGPLLAQSPAAPAQQAVRLTITPASLILDVRFRIARDD